MGFICLFVPVLQSERTDKKCKCLLLLFLSSTVEHLKNYTIFTANINMNTKYLTLIYYIILFNKINPALLFCCTNSVFNSLVDSSYAMAVSPHSDSTDFLFAFIIVHFHN